MRTIHALGFILLGLFFCVPVIASAATMDIVPASTHIVAGNIVTIRVLVNSASEAINAADGTLSFPTDFLKVLSLDTSNSIFPLWIQAPSFSNTQGTITFDGGIPSPGFAGAAGTILSVTFQAKKAGTATLALNNASVLANDGSGTDVLEGTNGTTLAIQNPPATESVRPVVVSTSSVIATTSTEAALPSPSIESYSDSLTEGQQFVLSGTVAAGTSGILLFEEKGNSELDQYTIQPDAQGYFTFISPSWSVGDYQIWTIALSDTGLRSSDSPHIALHIAPVIFARVGPLAITLTLVVIIVLAILIIQLGIALFSAYRLHAFKKNLREGILKSEKDIYKGFVLLKDDIRRHLKKTDVEGDVADLEQFVRKDFEKLRTLTPEKDDEKDS
jgi:Cohesin domain